jgi:hypothetical protein
MSRDVQFDTFQISIRRARSVRVGVWSCLSRFPEIEAVLATSRPDVLEIHYRADAARPAAWLGALSAAGYDALGPGGRAAVA